MILTLEIHFRPLLLPSFADHQPLDDTRASLLQPPRISVRLCNVRPLIGRSVQRFCPKCRKSKIVRAEMVLEDRNHEKALLLVHRVSVGLANTYYKMIQKSRSWDILKKSCRGSEMGAWVKFSLNLVS